MSIARSIAAARATLMRRHRMAGAIVLDYVRTRDMNRAADWLKQAERDLQVAENSAATGHHEWAAFAAHQCAEKAVKALVQSLHGSVRGHGITEILRSVPSSVVVPEEVMEAAGELDRVYLTSRHPNGFVVGSPGDYFSEGSSKRYIAWSGTILEFCRSQIH